MPIDIKAEVKKIQEFYSQDPRQATFNALVLGELGSGKSFLARTCRGPVHIDSFDPGGTKGLREEIAKGFIIADTRWENEDPSNPSVYAKWKREFGMRLRDGYFSHFGTYILDSSTTWAESIMNDILKKAGIPGQAPRFTKDYTPQKIEIRNMIRRMLDLPCDFILTGHLKANTDEVTGQVSYRYFTTGQGAVIIPTLFDEVYVMDPKAGSGGVSYRILTKSTGKHLARSRLAADGKLETWEEADIKKMLKKSGMDSSDKELFN